MIVLPENGVVVARSNFTLADLQGDEQRIFFGEYVRALDPSVTITKIVQKRVNLLNCDAPMGGICRAILMADRGAAVVIGAGMRFRRAVARRFAKGGLVAVPSRRKIQPLGELVAQIEAQSGQAEGIPCDARDEEAVIEMFDRIEADIGPVEVFVFNTGAQHRSSILDMTTRIYRQVWESATLAGFVTGQGGSAPDGCAGQGARSYLPARLRASVAVRISRLSPALNTHFAP